MTRRPLKHRHVRLAANVAVSVVIIAVAFAFALPGFAGYGTVWARLQALSPVWAAILAGATVSNLATFAFPWMVVIPRLTFLTALQVTQASTALISVLPGGAPLGMAISFAMLRSRNVKAREAGFAVALTGLWNQLTIFLFPVIGAALVIGTETLPQTLEWVAATGVVIALAVCALTAFSLADAARARRLGDMTSLIISKIRRLLRMHPVSWDGETLVSVRQDALVLLRRHWLALTATTLANQLTGYVMLDLSLRALGIPLSQLSIAETFAAWSIGRLLGSLPIGLIGLGVVEIGLVGTLVAFGGHDVPVVAGVLLYRTLVIAPTLILGALAGATWKLRH